MHSFLVFSVLNMNIELEVGGFSKKVIGLDKVNLPVIRSLKNVVFRKAK